MHDHRPGEALECRRGFVVGRARVDDDRLFELVWQLEMTLEEPELRVARCPVAKEVEPGLTHRDGLWTLEEGTDRLELVRLLPRPVRVHAERRGYALVPGCNRQGDSTRLEAAADRDDSLDAGRLRPEDEIVRLVRARVEVRVRIYRAAGG